MAKRMNFPKGFPEVEALGGAFCKGSCFCCSLSLKIKADVRRSTDVGKFLPPTNAVQSKLSKLNRCVRLLVLLISKNFEVKYLSCLATTLKGPPQGAEN